MSVINCTVLTSLAAVLTVHFTLFISNLLNKTSCAHYNNIRPLIDLSASHFLQLS
jgi:hypothetical protein